MSAPSRLASVRRRLWGLVLAPVAALALAVGVVPAPTAQAATLIGNDVSWPQCGTTNFGLPSSTQFVVIGLTNGLPFTENPCLAAQVQWAQSRSKPTHGYAMAAFPTAAQLTTYRAAGPWSSSTRAGQLSNVGYAEAQYAVASLDRIGYRPPVVWIDVEPRPSQPWPTSTATQKRENRYVVEGFMRGLRDGGFSYGVYSYLSGWQEVTGSWRLPGVPVWTASGTLDYPNEARDKCTQPSFSGGRVYLSQWLNDAKTLDYDLTCEPYAFTSIPVPPATLSNDTGDFNGDWKNDILARWTSSGTLKLYAGSGTGAIATGALLGSGWGAFAALETVGDFSGDGALDVLARETSTGYLWLYRGDGKGGWSLPRVRVGTGWGIFNSIVGVGDFTGDQRVDVIARRSSDGALLLYPGNGTGGWGTATRIGSGWNVMSSLLGPGDVNGDGRVDLVARERATGYLWLYPGNGAGGFTSRVRLGTSWNGMTALMSAGDLDGNRVPDVVARDGAGNLWLYPRTPDGWQARRHLGTGWNITNAIF